MSDLDTNKSKRAAKQNYVPSDSKTQTETLLSTSFSQSCNQVSF